MSNRLTCFAVLLGVACALRSVSAQAETRFTILDSSPSSWVARGYDNYTVSPGNGWAFGASVDRRDNSIRIGLGGPPLPGTDVFSWSMQFAAPHDEVITPGFYANFQRYPFQDQDRPGLSFSSTGRLDNRAAGFFEVFDVTFDQDGELLTFAADFTHYGETSPAKYAIAEIRFNSTVPEPSTYALAAIGVLGLLAFRRRTR